MYTINLNDTVMNNEKEIFNLFNDYFANIGRNLYVGMNMFNIDPLS